MEIIFHKLGSNSVFHKIHGKHAFYQFIYILFSIEFVENSLLLYCKSISCTFSTKTVEFNFPQNSWKTCLLSIHVHYSGILFSIEFVEIVDEFLKLKCTFSTKSVEFSCLKIVENNNGIWFSISR